LSDKSFSKKLLKWHKSNARSHPWKNTKDPYKIWISEIILQQTRVEAGTSYYLNFIKNFPTLNTLSKATLQEVLSVWKGLGYYSRARNLHTAAQFISNNLKGEFPQHYEDILSLKGVGPYTAAAIASFAFNQPYPVLDGNVKRVLARYHGYKENVLNSKSYKQLEKILWSYFDKTKPAAFNQAIMDFGATICKPKVIICHKCPLSKGCYAFQNNLTSVLPVRQKFAKRKDRHFHFFVISYKNKFLLEERKAKDIWQNLFQFILHESDSNQRLSDTELYRIASLELGQKLTSGFKLLKGPKMQLLTHQRIISRFYEIELNVELPNSDRTWFEKSELDNLALPKVIDWYLKDNSILLNF